MITGEEFARRMRRISQMRTLILKLRKAAREAYERGEIPYQPAYDIRSDYEYWKNLALEKGFRFDATGKPITQQKSDQFHSNHRTDI